MMRIGIIAFSQKGGRLGRDLAQTLEKKGFVTKGFLTKRYSMEGMEPFAGVGALTGRLFAQKELLIFVGACGIAVRAVAPYLKSKMRDPGVLVVDECGCYVISLLSGHVGRANEYAELVAGLLGAVPVITTATDRNGIFAVDSWAVKNGLRIIEPDSIREISARLLAGESVGFSSELPVTGSLPAALAPMQRQEAGIVVSYQTHFPKKKEDSSALCLLVPMDLVLGIGCKKGTSYEALLTFTERVMQERQLSMERVGKLCSISAKAKEEGLLRLADALNVPFETFTAEQLSQAEGSFCASAFVQQQMGVDNVCERSACLGSGNGNRLVEKQCFLGMTMAVYQRAMSLTFEGVEEGL